MVTWSSLRATLALQAAARSASFSPFPLSPGPSRRRAGQTHIRAKEGVAGGRRVVRRQEELRACACACACGVIEVWPSRIRGPSPGRAARHRCACVCVCYGHVIKRKITGGGGKVIKTHPLLVQSSRIWSLCSFHCLPRFQLLKCSSHWCVLARVCPRIVLHC